MDLEAYDLDLFRDFLFAIRGTRFEILESLSGKSLDARGIKTAIGNSKVSRSNRHLKKQYLAPLLKYNLISEDDTTLSLTDFGRRIYGQAKYVADYLPRAGNSKMKGPLILL